MAEFDEQQNKLTIKLVYYGPAQSGKTTNIMYLHNYLQPELKGEIMVLETQNDRTLFFDLLPLGFKTATGLLVKFKLFTVPGQVAHDGTRKALLSRADGVVFVADSQCSQGTNNAEAFENLADNAGRVGLNFETLPLVVQFNKRDLPNIFTEAAVRERWQATKWPLLFSSATLGDGVCETFNALLAQVYVSMDRQYALQAKYSLDQVAFIHAVLGNALAGAAL
ncbi:MAG TPA: GTPase domain-containing protein [Gammaproteobacteria bacterium]|nr:GTPase domain-containing protein [Gammaproteobacteria bacterium]